jgi:hypothetical protein
MLNRSRYYLVLVLATFPFARLSASDDTGALQTPLDLDPAVFELLVDDVDENGQRLIRQEFHAYRSQGLLEGCGYAFIVLIRDWAYRSNAPIIIDGSLIYQWYEDRMPAILVRLAISDIEERDGSLWRINSPPNYAYLRYGSESNAGKEYGVVDGEQSNRNFLYPDIENTSTNVPWFFSGDKFTVAFNRLDKSSDLEFELPLRESEIFIDLMSCYAGMLQQRL